MDVRTAKALLKQIQQVKQAETGNVTVAGLPAPASPTPTSFSFLARNMPNLLPGSLPKDLARQQNTKLQSDTQKAIIRTMMLAAGGGAAVRGLTGLTNMLGESPQIASTGRTVEMPVAYAEEPKRKKRMKQAEAFKSSVDTYNQGATNKIGLNYYIPGMLIGGGLAAYGGWKGVDHLLDAQRRKHTNEDMEAAKQEYEDALLGAYKKATDTALDQTFERYGKQAYLENIPGALQGAGLAYTAASLPIGYMIVNDMMKKNSKQALLQKALQERARRQAMTQPPEIYAIPHSPTEESE
jgi:hypothetical protein